MNRRRWTILIVPHSTDAPRQYEVGERGVRVLMGTLGSAGLLVLAAAVMLFSPWGTPGARLATRENVVLEQEIARLDAALMHLGDSIGFLAEREAQFRQMAGITTMDSARALNEAEMPAPQAIGLASLEGRAKPFAAFFGNRASRPDAEALIRRAGELSTAFRAVSDSMSNKIEKLRNTPTIMPTAGWLSSEFSRARRHPILHEVRAHEGIDVSAPSGSPIVAPAGGTVRRVAFEGGYGNMLEIDHGNGIRTRYAHCSRILVRPGMHVERGQTIARVGNTGLSVGPHLHYEIIVDGKPVNPLTYVLPTGTLP